MTSIYCWFNKQVLHRPVESGQYTSAELADAARLMDIRLSVGRTGVCWDNAVAESFFASLKRERWHRRPVPATRARARVEVADYIEVFHNQQRRHTSLEMLTPTEFENINVNRVRLS